METLLEKAKKIKANTSIASKVTPEVIELTMAWVRDEISPIQMSKVMQGVSGTSVYAYMAYALKQYILDRRKELLISKTVK